MISSIAGSPSNNFCASSLNFEDDLGEREVTAEPFIVRSLARSRNRLFIVVKPQELLLLSIKLSVD